MTTSAASTQLDWVMMESPLTLSAEDSLAKTSAPPEKAQGLPENDLACGMNTIDLSTKSARNTRSSKTSQPFALADWTRYSGGSLRSGTMRNGIVFPHPPLAPLTKGTAFGLWPTPRASEWKGVGPLGSKSHQYRLKKGYLDATVQEREQATGPLNPTWVEWLMGFPLGHTDLGHWVTPLSRKSRKLSENG